MTWLPSALFPSFFLGGSNSFKLNEPKKGGTWIASCCFFPCTLAQKPIATVTDKKRAQLGYLGRFFFAHGHWASEFREFHESELVWQIKLDSDFDLNLNAADPNAPRREEECGAVQAVRVWRLHQPPPPRAARVFLFSPPTAESFGVSAQIGSGVVRSGPEVRFHEGSTVVPPGFHEGSTRFCGASTQKSTACCWGYHLSILFFPAGGGGGGLKRGIPRKAKSSAFCSWVFNSCARLAEKPKTIATITIPQARVLI